MKTKKLKTYLVQRYYKCEYEIKAENEEQAEDEAEEEYYTQHHSEELQEVIIEEIKVKDTGNNIHNRRVKTNS